MDLASHAHAGRVVPPQWRVPFIALVSFFWLIILSTITAREAPPPAELEVVEL